MNFGESATLHCKADLNGDILEWWRFWNETYELVWSSEDGEIVDDRSGFKVYKYMVVSKLSLCYDTCHIMKQIKMIDIHGLFKISRKRVKLDQPGMKLYMKVLSDPLTCLVRSKRQRK